MRMMTLLYRPKVMQRPYLMYEICWTSAVTIMIGSALDIRMQEHLRLSSSEHCELLVLKLRRLSRIYIHGRCGIQHYIQGLGSIREKIPSMGPVKYPVYQKGHSMILDKPSNDRHNGLHGRIVREEDVHVPIDKEHDEDWNKGGSHEGEKL